MCIVSLLHTESELIHSVVNHYNQCRIGGAELQEENTSVLGSSLVPPCKTFVRFLIITPVQIIRNNIFMTDFILPFSMLIALSTLILIQNWTVSTASDIRDTNRGYLSRGYGRLSEKCWWSFFWYYSTFCSVDFITPIHRSYQINYVHGFKSVMMLDVNWCLL